MIRLESQGSFRRTDAFLAKMRKRSILSVLNRYGKVGCDALANATPVDTGLTAGSWTYDVEQKRKTYSIVWRNTHTENGMVIALLIQYGHGTGTGGFVRGYDYINPAIKPIFDRIAADVWKEVTSA